MNNTSRTMTLKQVWEIFELVYAEMPSSFTSYDFSALSRQLNVDEYYLHSGAIAEFLHKVALLNEKRGKVWSKKYEGVKNRRAVKMAPVIIPPVQKVEPKQSVITSIDEAINILKSAGYRIMKPVSQWEEI